MCGKLTEFSKSCPGRLCPKNHAFSRKVVSEKSHFFEEFAPGASVEEGGGIFLAGYEPSMTSKAELCSNIR